MYYVYVLQSCSSSYRYVGRTKDLESRLKQHNAGKTKSNRAYRPFQILYFESIPGYTEACRREKYLKSAGGRRFIKNKFDSPPGSPL
ncbi:MAG: GIY-YIG nuclease family protein [Candidatus Marinimicrobia bacterium]|nr:GIY-YIG nuclease family protein [Candidatus Neomarinimicrobiota bacterium]